MFKNILVSVSDKTGLLEFIGPMARAGARVVSTGGTAQFLKDGGIKVIQVSEQTGFPEVMDGRVRTLHPRIHMPLLARKGNGVDQKLLQDQGLEPFDLVVVNLYPFEEQLRKNKHEESEMIEYIDIGGPSLLRAAAKNFETLTVVCDPSDYLPLLQKGSTDLNDRRRLAAKVFAHTSAYDSLVTQYLSGGEPRETFSFAGDLVQELRYGENPQQSAWWFRRRGAETGWHSAQILQGKALSFNNLLDLEAAAGAVREFSEPAAVAVKHNNPCGVGTHKDPDLALELALKADPVSVFGGIIALNRPLTEKGAERLGALFLECVVVPSVTTGAREILAKKKNLRVLEWPEMLKKDQVPEVRSIQGGFLLQTPDSTSDWSADWKVLGETPNEDVRRDLLLSWKVVRHLKSNAIAIAEGGVTLGLGMGQVNRVESVEHALKRMKHHHPSAQRPVLASDAFFPFPDSIELIAQAGIRWVIQPGGSMKDQEVIECARKLGVNLIITGQRHFRH